MKRVSISSIITTLFATILVISLGGCGGKDKKQAEQLESPAAKVRLQPAVVQNVIDKADYTGVITPFETYYVAAGMAGRIDKLFVDLGSHVSKGDPLVRMDQTAVATLRTQLATVKRDFQRVDTLYRVGSATKQQYDQLKAQYEVMRKQLAQLEQNTMLYAPVSGKITGKYYNAGEIFTMAPSPKSDGKAAIVTLMQVNPVKVIIHPQEQFLAQLHDGMKVNVTVDAFENRTFSGEIYRISPTIDPVSHTVTVEIRVPNAKEELRPGMYARVSIPYSQHERVLVPDLAVLSQRGTNEKYVYVVEQGLAQRVVIQPGQREGEHIVVLEGLKGGEQVVVAGMNQLYNGSPVKVMQ